MSNASNKTMQIKCLDDLFSTGGSYTINELARELRNKFRNNYTHQGADSIGCSTKTVYRLIKELREMYNAKIIREKVGKEYEYKYEPGTTIMLPSYITKAEHFKYIDVLNNLLKTLKGTGMYKETEEALEQLSKFAPKVHQQDNSASSRIIFLGAPAAEINDEVYENIFEAMEHNYQIEIEYEKKKSDGSMTRGVLPYQLIYDNGTWDLWAKDNSDGKGVVKLFNLHKIKSVKIRKDVDKFTLPKDFNFKTSTPGTFGSWRNTNFQDYKIRLNKHKYVAEFVEGKEWGINTKIYDEGDFRYLEFNNNQEDVILRWVLGWGEDATPLAPQSLVDKWKKKVAQMEINRLDLDK